MEFTHGTELDLLSFNISVKIQENGINGKEQAFKQGFECAKNEAQLHISYLENELKKAKDRIVKLTDNNN